MGIFQYSKCGITLYFLLQFTATYPVFCQTSGVAVYKRIYYGKEVAAYEDTLKFSNDELLCIEKRTGQQWWSPEGYRITLEPRHRYWHLNLRTLNTVEVIYPPGKRKSTVWQGLARPPRWTILEAFKTIAGYRAQRAETVVEHPLGNYTATAWFTTAIPVSAGPSRFWGLPGLILELYEDNLGYTTLSSLVLEPVGNLTPENISGTKSRKKATDSTQRALQQILQKDGN
jgi:hypothetical protein